MDSEWPPERIAALDEAIDAEEDAATRALLIAIRLKIDTD